MKRLIHISSRSSRKLAMLRIPAARIATTRMASALMAAAWLTASCEVELELPPMQNEPKIYLQSFPGSQTSSGNETADTLFFRIQRTRPIGQPVSHDPFFPEIQLTVNGEPVTVRHYPGNDPGSSLPGEGWLATRSLQSGDRIAVSIRETGLPEASSHTVIPPAFPEAEIRLIRNKEYHTVSVSFRDDPATRDAYGLQVIEARTVTYEDGSSQTYYNPVIPMSGGTDLFGSAASVLDFSFDGYRFSSPRSQIRCWSDEQFSGKDVTLGFRINAVEEEPDETISYRLRMYRFTAEFFRYATMLNHIENNSLAEVGLAPASFSYTNIEGGVGILAGYSVREDKVPE